MMPIQPSPNNTPETGAAIAGPVSNALPSINDTDEVKASGSGRVVWIIAGFVLAFLAWAVFFEIDEVSSGTGQVIPTSREQRIQSLEGGILAELIKFFRVYFYNKKWI